MTEAEKEAIISKVALIIQEIPASVDLVKKGPKEQQRFEYFARHLIQKALQEDALMISKDGNGIAILLRTSKKTFATTCGMS